MRTLAAFAIFGISAASAATRTDARAKFEASQWLAAKFLGKPDSRTVEPHMTAYLRSGVVGRNRRKDRKFRIAGKEYERGLLMPSLGEIEVRLPGSGAAFDALVGVDSNDLGYYSNAGRGSVVASVDVNGREAFSSGVMREGLPAVPVKVSLGGAREFTLKLAAAGERPRTWQAEWDLADWAEARTVLSDGTVVWLDELPMGPLPALIPPSLRFLFATGTGRRRNCSKHGS
jgi:hypothetical protein